MWWKDKTIETYDHNRIPKEQAEKWIKKVTKQFHDLFFHSNSHITNFFGVQVIKPPTDLWMMQELIWAIKPRYFVEIGTFYGGTAFYVAHLFDLIGSGEVISLDINPDKTEVAKHPRVHLLTGNSIEEKTFFEVKSYLKEPGPVMVDIDGCHLREHTLQEMILYGSLVTVGSYMISEDSSNTETWWSTEKFLEINKSFVADRRCEKYILTYHPNGWLQRVS